MDQIWSDYHFLIFLRILVRINAKEFSENFREMNLGFSRTILYGSLADNNDNRKATKQGLVLRWQKNKGDRIFFLRKGSFFGDCGRGKWGFRREAGSGRVKPNLFIARSESAFQNKQTDFLSPFFTQSRLQFSNTLSSTSVFC